MITIDPPGSPHSAPSKPTLTRFLNRARTAIRLRGSVDVLLTSDAELKRLNQTFRNKNQPTDILSFPADPIPGLPLAHQHAGDLALSLDTAARQAAAHGHSLATELRILLLHGLLHLAGLDHESDTGEMAARESELRIRFRLPNTLIARTEESLPQPGHQLRSSRPETVPSPPSSRPNPERAARVEGAVERPLCFASSSATASPGSKPRPTKSATPHLRTSSRTSASPAGKPAPAAITRNRGPR